MKSQISPLQLRFFGFDNIQVESNDDYDSEAKVDAPLLPDVDIHVEEGDSDDLWYVTIAVRVNVDCDLGRPWETVPYALRIVVVSAFQITDEVEEKKRFWLTHMNAPAILYGLARAEIARLTAMNRFGRFILPSIDLIAMAQTLIESQEAEGEDEAEED